jgi:TonB-linked SusC/RagA family outer membrane protein
LDWNKELLRQGTRQEYGLSYSGTGEKSDYFASFGYLNEQGFLIKSDFRKFTGRVNVNTQPTSWFKTGFNLSGTLTNSNTANDGSSTGYVNPFYFTRNIGPIYPVYAHDQVTGDYLLDAGGNRYYDYGNMNGTAGVPSRPSGASPGRHVVQETKLNENLFKRNIASGRAFADVMFTKDLKFTTNISVDLTNYSGSTYDNKVIGDGAPAGRASKTSTTTTSYTFNQLLNYTKTINKHNFSVLMGHENYSFNYNYFNGSAQGQAVDGNTELVNFSTINSLTSYTDNYRIESYLSRVNYDYAGKYFVSGSLRRDGNSRFKKEFRWDNFWSIGAGWRIDKEAFMSISWIDQLKLRSSYGRVGNDAIRDNNGNNVYYPYQALYSLGFNNATEPGIRQSSLPNDSIRWEGAKSADIGIDFSLFKNRLSGSIEYYNRTTDNMIFPVQVPLSNGGYTLSKNIGEMVNKGVEIQLSGEIVRKKNFSWRMDVNWTTLKNEITKMPPGQPTIISGTKQLQVGHSMYDYWLRDWQGVDPSDGAALYKAVTYNTTDGRIRGKEDTVTTNINNAQYKYAGSAIPDFYGSIGNTFTYKAFELSFMFTYQVGGKIYDASYATLMNPGSTSSAGYGAALHVDMLKGWQKAGDITDIPRMDNSKGGIFDATSSRFLTDASFLNFRSVSIAYNIPKAWLSRITVSNARLFVSGENLAWLSARKAMNVQQSFTGVTSNTYVPARTFTVGLNVNF